MAVVAAGHATCTDFDGLPQPPARAPGAWRVTTTVPAQLPYLQSYPAPLQQQARDLLAQGRLGAALLRKYPDAHAVRSDKALYDYAQELKNRHLRNAGAINKVLFDNKIHVVRHALGLHTTVSRVQGNRLATKHEIRIAAMFKQGPDEFLRMIVVHELAHLREKDHGKAFYQLCQHMEPQYHQYEFDLRMYLTHVEHTGERLWGDGETT